MNNSVVTLVACLMILSASEDADALSLGCSPKDVNSCMEDAVRLCHGLRHSKAVQCLDDLTNDCRSPARCEGSDFDLGRTGPVPHFREDPMVIDPKDR
jgi:hypothetical protein